MSDDEIPQKSGVLDWVLAGGMLTIVALMVWQQQQSSSFPVDASEPQTAAVVVVDEEEAGAEPSPSIESVPDAEAESEAMEELTSIAVLPFRDARLYVVSNAPGDVSVASGSGAGARGRTREILSVPMRRAEDTRRIAIGAPGYARYTASVRLRAGALTEQRVTLIPEAAPPPDISPE